MKECKNGEIHFKNKAELSIETKKRVEYLIKQEMEKIRIQATKDAGTLMLPLIASALYEAYGFGEKRLEKFVEYFNKHLECLNDGIITVDQYEQWCKDQGYKCLIVEAEE